MTDERRLLTMESPVQRDCVIVRKWLGWEYSSELHDQVFSACPYGRQMIGSYTPDRALISFPGDIVADMWFRNCDSEPEFRPENRVLALWSFTLR
jgi:hypothetical protein